LFEDNPECKILLYKYSKKWYGLIYALHKEDWMILLKMVLEIYSYNECNINMINIQDLCKFLKDVEVTKKSSLILLPLQIVVF
jgi:hypothetical protein